MLAIALLLPLPARHLFLWCCAGDALKVCRTFCTPFPLFFLCRAGTLSCGLCVWWSRMSDLLSRDIFALGALCLLAPACDHSDVCGGVRLLSASLCMCMCEEYGCSSYCHYRCASATAAPAACGRAGVCACVCLCVCVHVSFSFFGCLPVQLQIRPLEHLLFYFWQHASGLIAQLVRAYGQ